MTASPWNSLEAVKLVVSVVTPVVVVGLGIVVSRAARRIERADWLNRELIQRRLQIYDLMAPLLNDLFCFFCLRGAFQDIDPPTAVKHKRQLDADFHINQFLFSNNVADKYANFISTCFRMFTGAGQQAKLRAHLETHRKARETWDPTWNRCYVSEANDMSLMSDVTESYSDLMESLARDIGVYAPEVARHRVRRVFGLPHKEPVSVAAQRASRERAAVFFRSYDSSKQRICSTCGITVPEGDSCPACGELD